jgi:hypothetical protein
MGQQTLTNFSVDFQRQFGHQPSEVLRFSRGTRLL